MKKTLGKLTTIFGPMYSGKTSKLIEFSKILTEANEKLLVIKPKIDNRYGQQAEIHSHDNQSFQALLSENVLTDQIIKKIHDEKIETIIIDEVQFFEKKSILATIQDLRQKGIDVIVAGLRFDYRRAPFGAVEEFIQLADTPIELFAICQKCGNPAQHTERISGGQNQIDVGETNKYIAVCEACHHIFPGS